MLPGHVRACCLQPLWHQVGRTEEFWQIVWPAESKVLLSGPFQKTFANPFLRTFKAYARDRKCCLKAMGSGIRMSSSQILLHSLKFFVSCNCKKDLQLPFILKDPRCRSQLTERRSCKHWPPAWVCATSSWSQKPISQGHFTKWRLLFLRGQCNWLRRLQRPTTYLVLFPPDDLRWGLDLVHVLMEGVSRLLADDFHKHFSEKEDKVSARWPVPATVVEVKPPLSLLGGSRRQTQKCEK